MIMLVAMLCAAGLALTALRVARANDLRSAAQTAADAAAVAAVTPLRDAALAAARAGEPPDLVGLWSVAPDTGAADTPYARAARRYAAADGAVLTGKVTPSGARGQTMKASVRTRGCVIKEDGELTDRDRDDLAHRRNVCTDARGRTGIVKGHGTATAVAELRLPECRHVNHGGTDAEANYDELRCDGVTVWRQNGGGAPRSRIIRLFKIRLVAKEDPTPYTGTPFSGIDGGGGTVQNHCKNGRTPDPGLPFGERVVAWAQCWIGTPYSWGGGGASGPGTGICCSPGGYSGANTVGFDCSGLTQYAVYQASRGRITLPRTTYGQVNAGLRVSAGELRPGDLILPNPGHVAVYAGNGQMVEAPRTGETVRVAPIAGRGFYAGVRITPPAGDR